MTSKRDLRRRAQSHREALTAELARAHGALISQQVAALPEYRQARCVACYVSVGREVDTRALIASMPAAGKQAAVPVIRAHRQMVFQAIASLDDLKPAPFGLLEPAPDASQVVPPEALDLLLVPGLVFDRQGYRVGYGGGYYDRFLIQTRALRVGLAYDFQLVDTVPVDEHDVPMDMVVTEREVVRCRTRR